jgi:hypothetical protein
MEEPIDEREGGLRRLPAPYSLALRLRDAGVDDTVICGYVAVEPEALPMLLEIAEEKLAAACASPSTGQDPPILREGTR